MTNETVIYNQQPKPKLTVDKSLELQQRILNGPEQEQEQKQRLIARSGAVKTIEKRLTVEDCLALQKKIVPE